MTVPLAWSQHFTASGHFTYRPVYHAQMLRPGVLCGSQDEERLFPYAAVTILFLGLFAKFRHVHLLVRLNNSASTGRTCHARFEVLTSTFLRF